MDAELETVSAQFEAWLEHFCGPAARYTCDELALESAFFGSTPVACRRAHRKANEAAFLIHRAEDWAAMCMCGRYPNRDLQAFAGNATVAMALIFG